MNHDDPNKPDLSTHIDPELEARIVAWVSGEASPFEAAELTRLTNEKPELAIFKRRIEAVRGLVAEATRPDQTPLRLAPERRAKLLQALGATESKIDSDSKTSTRKLPLAYSQTKKRRNRQWMLAIAASLTVGFFFLFPYRQFQNEFAMKSASRKAPREPVAVALPVEENMELRAEADSDRRRELVAANAATGARKMESEKKALSARDGSSPRATNEVAQQKFRQASDQNRAYGTVRYDFTKAKAENGLKLPYSPASPPAPANNAVAFDLPNPPSLVGISAPTDGKPRQYKSVSRGFTAQGYSKGFMAQGYVAGGEKKFTLNKEQIALSPFAVSSSNDKGYAAKDTLGGSRLNVQLKDVGSAVTAVTKEFLQDTGASGSQKLLAYASETKTDGTRTSQNGNEVDANSADLPQERPKIPAPSQTFSEIITAKEPVSTFSLHVSDVSFRLAQAALAKGEALDRASIRPEEFYNAFSYGDPTPALAEKVSCRIEQAAHPFAQQRNLVRIAVKVAAAGRDAAQPLHLTVLLDTSGSMEREDRAATIQSAMKALTSLLGPNDHLTLIGFSRQPRLLAESLAGDQAAQVVLDLIKNTPSEGGTNLEEALKLGSELAHRHFEATAQNRIVLLTDGAANLGNANPAQLAASIEALRQQGIAFDACGVGLEGLDDGMLENLTRKGDGRYYVLNSPEAADAGFAKQLAGAFRPAAENVKLQVRFNPARVGHYRLIGFEQHRLKEEDFRNDQVDAAELAAEEAAVAVYQIEALPQGEGELGEVYVRFRDPSSGNMVERNWTLNYDAQAPAFDRATPSIQLAGVAALLAEKLQGGETANAINLKDLAPIVNKLRSHYAHEPRVQELATMFEQARKLAGE